MTMPALTFSSGQATAPTGSPAPTAREIKAMSMIAAEINRAGRATLMNQICAVLNMPPGGWSTGQSHLFENEDIRLAALLRLLTKDRAAKSAADNLRRAASFTDANVLLATVTAAREHTGALTASGSRMINSYYEGGLDFLWDEKDRLGLPKSITGNWDKAEIFINPESNHEVHPARIPAGDQMVVYAAQIATSFRVHFKKALSTELRDQGADALARTSRAGILVWQSYTFLAPGGSKFDPSQPIRNQLGQHFGIRSALGYIMHLADQAKAAPDLNRVYTDSALNPAAWIRSAKTRTAETLFLESLLKQARLMLPT